MIEKAFVSGQIAQAIFKEDDKLFLIKAKDTENIMECTPYEESLFFNSDTEIKVFGNIEIDELRKTLVKEKSNFDALYAVVGGFDPNLSEKTRILSIQRAENLVKYPGIFDFVIFRLFGNPVPKDAALKKAVKLSTKNGFQEMNAIYKKLLNNSDVIEYILSIFKDTIWELSLETEFVMIKNIFVTSGIFAKFFFCINICLNITFPTIPVKDLYLGAFDEIVKDRYLEGLDEIIYEFSDSSHIKEKIPSIWTILTEMKSKIETDKLFKKHKFAKLSRPTDIRKQASYIKKKSVECPDAKKGVSFVKIKDPHYENDKGETDKPTTSKKQK